MNRKHIGSDFNHFLREKGISERVEKLADRKAKRLGLMKKTPRSRNND